MGSKVRLAGKRPQLVAFATLDREVETDGVLLHAAPTRTPCRVAPSDPSGFAEDAERSSCVSWNATAWILRGVHDTLPPGVVCSFTKVNTVIDAGDDHVERPLEVATSGPRSEVSCQVTGRAL